MKKILSILTLMLVVMTASAYELKSVSPHATVTFKVGDNTASTASEGDVVTVTVTPATGWAVDQVSGKWYAADTRSASSTEIPMLKDIDLTASTETPNTYTFTMERANAEITVTYKKLITADMITLATPTPNNVYTGAMVVPTETVKYMDGENEVTLVKETDYTVNYADNTNVPAANATDDQKPRIIITAKTTSEKVAESSASKTFEIVAKKLNNGDGTTNEVTVDDIADQTYTGSALTPAPVVKYGDNTLVKGTDYDYADTDYSNNINVGPATLQITGKGNYQGTRTVNFNIVAKSVSGLTVTLNPTGYEYDGTAKQPAVTVTDPDRTDGDGNPLTLTENTDYTVAYSNNTNVGTAKVTITGMGNYTGSKEVTFPIWEPTYQVSSSTDGNGTASVSPAWAENGQTVTVSATPKEGYEVDQILVNGAPISGNSFTYNFGDQVSVTFRLKQEPAPVVGDEKTIVDENGNRYTVKVTEVETNPETGEKVNDVIVTSVPEDVLNGKKEMQPTIINYAGNDYEVKTVAAEAFDKKAENVIIFLPEAAKTTAPVENVVNGDGTVEVLNLTPVTKFNAPREVKAERVVYLRDVTAEITTICLPYDAPIPAEWTVYDLARDKDGKVEFNLWGRPRLEANHPFLLKYKVTAGARSSRDAAALTATAETLDFSADNATIEATEELEPVIGDDFKLYGTLDDMTHREGYDLKAYTLQPDGSWKMSASSAYWQRDNVYLKAFNAYLLKSVYTGTSIGTSLDDTTTGISTVEAQTSATDGAWFTLDGKRLSGKPARKGVYVRGGKKIVVK